MIAAKDKPTNLTPEEYFAWEEKQLEKHELINGQVYPMGIYAMTDGSKNHSLLAARLITNSKALTSNSPLNKSIAV
ncbi:Uma2 family endonuclease [Nostoc sp. PCC 7524]|uniref:Uma2 family endonuclease n=1 Tax=Nostoc sp. (strain ATCC 29411 / PCC 7524) TaxID=28072 RepID=UPI00068852A9|nr:Uma2 family endonuclease [Nostoc sp. PCC 7524]